MFPNFLTAMNKTYGFIGKFEHKFVSYSDGLEILKLKIKDSNNNILFDETYEGDCKEECLFYAMNSVIEHIFWGLEDHCIIDLDKLSGIQSNVRGPTE